MDKKLNSIIILDHDKIHNYIAKKLVEKLGLVEDIFICNGGEKDIDNLIKAFSDKFSGNAKEGSDVLLVDLQVPLMQLQALIKKLKVAELNNWDTLRLIGISTIGKNDQFIEVFQNIGVKMVIEKPVTPDKLLDALSRIPFSEN